MGVWGCRENAEKWPSSLLWREKGLWIKWSCMESWKACYSRVVMLQVQRLLGSLRTKTLSITIRFVFLARILLCAQWNVPEILRLVISYSITETEKLLFSFSSTLRDWWKFLSVTLGLERWLAIKGRGCSGRVPEYDSQNPCWAAYKLLVSPANLMLSSGHSHIAYMHTYV